MPEGSACISSNIYVEHTLLAIAEVLQGVHEDDAIPVRVMSCISHKGESTAYLRPVTASSECHIKIHEASKVYPKHFKADHVTSSQ